MPNFYSYEVRKATVTLRNPNPVIIGVKVYLTVGTYTQMTTDFVNIPANSQISVDFTVAMAQVGVGTAKPVYVEASGMDGKIILSAQGENVNVYSPSLELVGVTWV